MATFTKQIDADIRDLNSQYNGSTWSTSISGAYNIGNPGAVTRNISLRFTGITIPQGTTINSAKITFLSTSTQTVNITSLIEGVDEDNTSEFDDSPEDSARTRTHTTANVAWSGSISQTNNTNIDTPSITSIVQEIIDRAGWSSGNAMAFWLSNNGTSSGNYLSFAEYSTASDKSAILTIDYVSATSPSLSPSLSPSVTPSSSISLSPSLSTSLSPSASTSISSSVSLSPSPSQPIPFFGLKIAKSGINVLTENEPNRLIFSSDYGTLKYFYKGTIDVTVKCNSTDLEIRGTASYTHNLGYYPFVEVYMKDPIGTYAYCPCILTGASTYAKGGYVIGKNDITFFVDNSGYPSFTSNKTYTFIFFIFKNNLQL